MADVSFHQKYHGILSLLCTLIRHTRPLLPQKIPDNSFLYSFSFFPLTIFFSYFFFIVLVPSKVDAALAAACNFYYAIFLRGVFLRGRWVLGDTQDANFFVVSQRISCEGLGRSKSSCVFGFYFTARSTFSETSSMYMFVQFLIYTILEFSTMIHLLYQICFYRVYLYEDHRRKIL